MNVPRLNLPKKVIRYQNSQIFPRQNVTLTCKHKNADSATWYKNNVKILEHSSTFDIVSYSEVYHAGLYQCLIHSNSACLMSETLNIVTNNQTPRIDNAPNRVNNGTIVKLKCRTNNPEHQLFRWFRNHTILLNNQKYVIKFKPFQYGDDGVYHCEASDLEGKHPQTSNKVNLTTVGIFDLCKCPCPASIANMSLTEAELEEKVTSLVRELSVDRTNVSAAVHRKRARENKHRGAMRVAKGITIATFVLVFGTILIFDGACLLAYLYKEHLRPFLEKRKSRRVVCEEMTQKTKEMQTGDDQCK